MNDRKWNTTGETRNSSVFGLRSGHVGFAAVLILGALLGLSGSASAQLCNASLLEIAIVADTLVAVPGQTVNYRVLIRNDNVAPDPPEAPLFFGCTVQDVDATFFCPDLAGNPNGPSTVVITNGVFPADNVLRIFPPLTDPPFTCVMPAIDGFAFAEVRGPAADLINEEGQIVGAVTIQKSIAVNVQTTVVKVDKAVSCNSEPFIDAALVVANDDGTNSCSALDGQLIAVQYQVQNAGEAPLFQCTLSVVQANATPSSFSPTPIPIGNLASSQTTLLIPAVNSPQACSEDLEDEEPDTATVTCCTVDVSPCPDGFAVSAFDVAAFSCIQPALNVEKVCVDANRDGIGEVTVTASAVGSEANLVDCEATDVLFRDDPTCPADVGVGTPVALTPASPFSIAAGASLSLSGLTPEPPLTANACNTVEVSCTIEGTETTISDTADAVCPGAGQGCLTRTPGFWGNHPHITETFLPLEVCGVPLDTVAAGSGTSATEAICSVGRDGQILGPQLTQLVRQCTAALLNVEASASGGGNCTGDVPPLTALLDGCCGAESVCTGDPVAGLTIQACIDQLDAFNNSNDTLPPFGPFVRPGPADSSLCRAARNNGVVVTPAP